MLLSYYFLDDLKITPAPGAFITGCQTSSQFELARDQRGIESGVLLAVPLGMGHQDHLRLFTSSETEAIPGCHALVALADTSVGLLWPVC